MDTAQFEQLRRRYKPETIRILFVAESPPAGGTFFYSANSNLYQYTRDAFEFAFGKGVAEGKEFLRYFQNRGCYLDDLCLVAVNHMKRPDRLRCRKEGVPPLAKRMREHTPRAIVVIKSDIDRHVADAADIAGLGELPRWTLPFPAMSWQGQYVEKLSSLLPKLPML
jgi:hypothetical protein